MICFIFVHSHLYTYHECYLYMVTLTNKFLIRNNGVMILYNDRIVNQIFPMNDYLERLFHFLMDSLDGQGIPTNLFPLRCMLLVFHLTITVRKVHSKHWFGNSEA